jgi:serine phosphatase RsbU (regulator of sigma subunit)
MLLYTDGIVEVPNNAGEEFGYTRFETHLRESIFGAPEQFRRSLVKTALQFSAADGFEDDVTIVVVACE